MNESSSSSHPSSRGGSGSGGGRPRGGRRRRPGGSGSHRSPSSTSGGFDPDAPTSSPAAATGGKADKPGLLQRVLSLFGGGGKKKPASKHAAGAAPNAHRTGYGRVPGGDEAAAGSSRPARPPREPRAPRKFDNGRDGARDGAGADAGGGGRERGSRRPESIEVTTPRLYVGNLSFDTTETDLTELFNGVGRVVSAEIVTHRQTQRSKGFAFVQMTGVDEAKRAVEQLHDKDFMGRKLFLSGAKAAEPRDGLDEPRFAT